MHVLLLGVRGSTPAPGADYVRYGGHTACVAVFPHGQADPPLVLDAGTGLRSLSRVLAGRPFTGTILLSHLHWDHMQGLPFFASGDHPQARTELFVPSQDGASARDLLARTLSPPSFPITPEGLRGRWTFACLEEGRHRVAGFTVHAAAVAHKGGRTFGYRIDGEDGSLAYLPDHAPARGLGRTLLRDVHALVGDAPPRGCQELGQQVEEGGLAGAIGPDEGMDIAPAHLQVHVVDRDEALEFLGQALGFQDGLCGQAFLRVGRGMPWDQTPRRAGMVSLMLQRRKGVSPRSAPYKLSPR